MGDDQFVAGAISVDRTCEFCECFPGQRWTAVALLVGDLIEKPSMASAESGGSSSFVGR